MNPLSKLFSRNKFTGRVIVMANHTYWGDNIYFSDISTGEITGWLNPLPKKGDRVLSNMKSGKRAYFQITKIKYMNNHGDMFFATVKWVGYEGDGE